MQTGAQRGQQRGAVLIVSLIMLLILTLLGVAAMQTTTMEERMAGSMHAHNIAFQSAEMGLRQGEVALRDSGGDLAGIYEPDDDFDIGAGDCADNAVNGDTVDDAKGTAYFVIQGREGFRDIGMGGASDGPEDPVSEFLIQTRACGPGDSADVILESRFIPPPL